MHRKKTCTVASNHNGVPAIYSIKQGIETLAENASMEKGNAAEFWRSLRTEDKDTAVAKSAQWESRVQRVFLTLKHYGAEASCGRRGT
jgi:hypothetical protein